jgi:hypothetical protein
MGADEQLGGYSRHRTAFRHRGLTGLLDEVALDIDRIADRNLGRDDRCARRSGILFCLESAYTGSCCQGHCRPRQGGAHTLSGRERRGFSQFAPTSSQGAYRAAYRSSTQTVVVVFCEERCHCFEYVSHRHRWTWACPAASAKSSYVCVCVCVCVCMCVCVCVCVCV